MRLIIMALVALAVPSEIMAADPRRNAESLWSAELERRAPRARLSRRVVVFGCTHCSGSRLPWGGLRKARVSGLPWGGLRSSCPPLQFRHEVVLRRKG